MLVRLVSNSQPQVIHLPWSPKVMGLQASATAPSPRWIISNSNVLISGLMNPNSYYIVHMLMLLAECPLLKVYFITI